MKTFFLFITLVALISMVALNGCQKESDAETERAEATQYTTAAALEVEGAGNLYKVSDDLYRCEQPTAEGFKELQALGIKTVINLRANHSDTDELEGVDMELVSIPMNTWDPELEHVQAFLEVMTDDTKLPALVHCMHGSDRTGTMVAVYRMVVEDMPREEAVDEMTKGPFGYHTFWKGLPEFLEELDVEQLKAQYITEPASAPAQ